MTNWMEIDFTEAIEKISTNEKKLKQKDYLSEGNFPVIDQGQAFIGGYTNDASRLIKGQGSVIVFGDHTRIVKLVPFDFVPGADGVKVIKPRAFYNPRLFSFFMSVLAQMIPNKGYARHFQHLEATKIPFPSYNEQEHIVEKIEEMFSDLDNAIENLKKAQEQLKVYRQAVLKCAFEGQFTKGWRHSNPYPIGYLKTFMARIDELNSIKDGGDLPRRLPPINLKDLYVLPEDWVWLEAHKVCQSVRDGTHDTPKYVDNGIPLVTSKNLKEGKIDFEDVDFISDEDHKKIQDRSVVDLGDILFGMIGTIGNPVVITDKRPFSIKNVGLFKMNQGLVISGYLKYWLDSSLMMHILQEKDLIRGTTQKFIALGGLRVLPVPVPSVNEQSEILNEIESRFSVCNKLEETIESSLKRAEALRQSILKQAFEGNLTEHWRKEHKDLISGENSAEALLKKIKAEKEALQVKPKGKK
jgi:type I restriction enzyme S subunit